jgi:uncharacterized membrane protein (UPF0127 family)
MSLFVFVNSLILILLIKINLPTSYNNNGCDNPPYIHPVNVNNNVLCVEIVDTPEKMSKGLSEREDLKENQGMLFVFGDKNIPGFWMKDMKFPIDIIWINDNEIVDISKNVPVPDASTTTQPPNYSPSEPVNYVLEVNAGYVDKYNVEIGNTIEIN